MKIIQKKSFGKGLDDILSISKESVSLSQSEKTVVHLSLEKIKPCRYQPRITFNENAIEELSSSIRQHGVIQPILVRFVDEQYEIIAGERRYRASKIAGISEIPAIVLQVDENSVMAFTLIENIQRESLNPIEEARGINLLIEKQSLTHQQVAELIGKSRSQTTNMLRLLTLSGDVQEMLVNRQLDMGHARAILILDDYQQREIAAEVVAKRLSVRQTEELVRKLTENNNNKHVPDTETKKAIDEILSRIESKYSFDIAIKAKKDGGYRLTIEIDSLEELENIFK